MTPDKVGASMTELAEVWLLACSHENDRLRSAAWRMLGRWAESCRQYPDLGGTFTVLADEFEKAAGGDDLRGPAERVPPTLEPPHRRGDAKVSHEYPSPDSWDRPKPPPEWRRGPRRGWWTRTWRRFTGRMFSPHLGRRPVPATDQDADPARRPRAERGVQL